MKIKGLVFGLVIGIMFFGANAFADPISFNFSNLPNTAIAFSGGSFTFTSSGGQNISITDNPGVAGLTGQLGGTYSIGAVSSDGWTGFTAPVAGSGVFSIDDGLGGQFTANLDFVDINQDGNGGSLNINGTVNLTGLAYSHLASFNPLLADLAGHHDGIVGVTFQLGDDISLSDLAAGAEHTSSFSGSLYSDSQAVPEPGSSFLLGAGLLGLALVERRRRSVNA